MIGLFKCCYLIIAILIVGDVVNSICFKNKFKYSLPITFSIAYSLGTGILGLLMFYLSYLGGTVSFRNVFFLSLPFMAYFVCNSIKSKGSILKIKSPTLNFRKDMLKFFFLMLIVLSLAIATFRALYLPMHLSDDRMQWGIKAKILYHEGTIYSQDFFDPARVMYHASYPFLVPLIESFFYSALGDMNDCLVKIPFPLFFLALLLFFYVSQKRFAGHQHALMLTSMLAVLPIFIKDINGNPSSGFSDIPLTLYYTISVISLFFWIKEHRTEDIFMATICITFSIFAKKEGMILWTIAVVAILFYLLMTEREILRNKLLWWGFFVGVPLIMLLPWFQFQGNFNTGPWEKDFELSYLTYEHIYSQSYRIPFIVNSFLKKFFTPFYFNIIWIIFIITIVLSLKDFFCSPQVFLLLLLVLNLCALFFAILVYPWPWWGNFLGDLPRLLMLNIPLMMYMVSYQLHRHKFFQSSA